jgi:hypothetical protein
VKYRAEILTAMAWLLGWALVTWGGGSIVRGEYEAAVWRVSLGLILVSLGGWRLLYVVVRDGLYTLTRDDR